jgi:hypothetical protein
VRGEVKPQHGGEGEQQQPREHERPPLQSRRKTRLLAARPEATCRVAQRGESAATLAGFFVLAVGPWLVQLSGASSLLPGP